MAIKTCREHFLPSTWQHKCLVGRAPTPQLWIWGGRGGERGWANHLSLSLCVFHSPHNHTWLPSWRQPTWVVSCVSPCEKTVTEEGWTPYVVPTSDNHPLTLTLHLPANTQTQDYLSIALLGPGYRGGEGRRRRIYRFFTPWATDGRRRRLEACTVLQLEEKSQQLQLCCVLLLPSMCQTKNWALLCSLRREGEGREGGQVCSLSLSLTLLRACCVSSEEESG